MTEKNDILNNEKLRRNPFEVPEGYFASMEDSLRASVFGKKTVESGKTARWTVMKPAFSLALMFFLIFGMGWGMLKLTDAFIDPKTDVVEYAEELDLWQSVHIEYVSESEQDNEIIENQEIDHEEILEYFTSGRFSQMYMYNYLASNER